LIIDAAAVRAAFPMSEAVDVMRTALRAHAEGDVYQPMRMALEPPQLSGLALVKPAALGGERPAFGMKVVCLFPDNPKRGIPAVSGFVALFDTDTGAPTAILDGAVVTEIRTGAVSAVATDLLAGSDAGDLALLGAGVQARAHLDAVAAVRRIRRVRVWNHKPDTAEAFVAWAGEHGYQVESCPTARSPRPASRCSRAIGSSRART
jgi:ornithine cyclodeaminase